MIRMGRPRARALFQHIVSSVPEEEERRERVQRCRDDGNLDGKPGS